VFLFLTKSAHLKNKKYNVGAGLDPPVFHIKYACGTVKTLPYNPSNMFFAHKYYAIFIKVVTCFYFGKVLQYNISYYR